MKVLRWGRSAYETDDALAGERQHAMSLGLDWVLQPNVKRPPGERADALVVTSKVQVTGAILDAVQPRLVLTTTSGYEHVHVPACTERGVIAARSPMARRDAVVEQSIEGLIRLMRRLPEQEGPAQQGRWTRHELQHLAPRGLRGSTIVLIGLGVIGQRMAQVLDLFGADVVGVDPFREVAGVHMLPLDEALDRADAVSLHAASTPSSRNLFNADRLASLPAGCVVINTARGDLLDPDAAAALVHRGHLGGLACDVFPTEPYPRLRDWAGPRVLLTPHAAGYTHDLGHRVAHSVGDALTAWCNGGAVPWRLNEGPIRSRRW